MPWFSRPATLQCLLLPICQSRSPHPPQAGFTPVCHLRPTSGNGLGLVCSETARSRERTAGRRPCSHSSTCYSESARALGRAAKLRGSCFQEPQSILGKRPDRQLFFIGWGKLQVSRPCLQHTDPAPAPALCWELMRRSPQKTLKSYKL